MVSRGLVFLTLLSTLQAFQLFKGAELSNSHISLLSLKEDSCALEIPLGINCGNWDCSVNAEVVGYTAIIDLMIGNAFYITVTDEDETDESENCTEFVTATVTCSDPDSCPLETYEVADLFITMPDGTLIELLGVKIEDGVL